VERRVVAALLASLTTTSFAMRLSGIKEYATLTKASVARSGRHSCTAAAGCTVEIVGRPTSLSDPAVSAHLFVRVTTGRCAGYELTIAEALLSDFRETLEPPTQQKPPPR
jgi:hypothetical protein